MRLALALVVAFTARGVRGQLWLLEPRNTSLCSGLCIDAEGNSRCGSVKDGRRVEAACLLLTEGKAQRAVGQRLLTGDSSTVPWAAGQTLWVRRNVTVARVGGVNSCGYKSLDKMCQGCAPGNAAVANQAAVVGLHTCTVQTKARVLQGQNAALVLAIGRRRESQSLGLYSLNSKVHFAAGPCAGIRTLYSSRQPSDAPSHTHMS